MYVITQQRGLYTYYAGKIGGRKWVSEFIKAEVYETESEAMDYIESRNLDVVSTSTIVQIIIPEMVEELINL